METTPAPRTSTAAQRVGRTPGATESSRHSSPVGSYSSVFGENGFGWADMDGPEWYRKAGSDGGGGGGCGPISDKSLWTRDDPKEKL